MPNCPFSSRTLRSGRAFRVCLIAALASALFVVFGQPAFAQAPTYMSQQLPFLLNTQTSPIFPAQVQGLLMKGHIDFVYGTLPGMVGASRPVLARPRGAVSIRGRATPDPVERNDVLTYTLYIRNDDVRLRFVDVWAMLDPDTSFESATFGGYSNGTLVRWDDLAIEPGLSRTLMLHVRVRPRAPLAGELRLTVQAESSVDTVTAGVINEFADRPAFRFTANNGVYTPYGVPVYRPENYTGFDIGRYPDQRIRYRRPEHDPLNYYYDSDGRKQYYNRTSNFVCSPGGYSCYFY